jgi:hypothetical protein
MTGGGPSARRGRLARAVDAHLGSRDVARVIYGAVIGLALVVALQVHPPTAGQAAAAVFGTAVAVGLAEAYSEIVSGEARARRRLHVSEVRAVLLESASVVLGAGFPALFLLLASLGAIDLELAFNLSKWTGLALLCAYGFVAGRVSGWGLGGSLVHSAAVGAIGGALIGLKALLH